MSLNMLLQILRSLEGLAAEIAMMRLQWDMNANVRGYVVTLDNSDMTIAPSTSQIKIVGALTPNVVLTNMVLEAKVSGGSSINLSDMIETTYIKLFGAMCSLHTADPLALELAVVSTRERCCRCLLMLQRLLLLLLGVLMRLTPIRSREALALALVLASGHSWQLNLILLRHNMADNDVCCGSLEKLDIDKTKSNGLGILLRCKMRDCEPEVRERLERHLPKNQRAKGGSS